MEPDFALEELYFCSSLNSLLSQLAIVTIVLYFLKAQIQCI